MTSSRRGLEEGAAGASWATGTDVLPSYQPPTCRDTQNNTWARASTCAHTQTHVCTSVYTPEPWVELSLPSSPPRALTAIGMTEDSPHHPSLQLGPVVPVDLPHPGKKDRQKSKLHGLGEVTPFAAPEAASRGGRWGQGIGADSQVTQQRRWSPPCLCTPEGPRERRDCGSVLVGPQGQRAGPGSSFLQDTPQTHSPSLLWVPPCLDSP